jgi:RHS repeat-associated protein
VGRVQYDPYGEVLTSTLPVTLTDRLFTGQRFDSSTGLYYYNARYYDPHLGRFIQPDTLVPDPLNPQAWNRFSYVYNNPASYVDPSGHFAFLGIPLIGWIFIGGAVAGATYYGIHTYATGSPFNAWEFASYTIGGGVLAVSAYFLAADLALVAGIGMQGVGLWTGSTTLFGLGLRATSFWAGMYYWAFRPARELLTAGQIRGKILVLGRYQRKVDWFAAMRREQFGEETYTVATEPLEWMAKVEQWAAEPGAGPWRTTVRDLLNFVSDAQQIARAETIYQNTWNWQGSPYTISEMIQTCLWGKTGLKQIIRFYLPWGD